MTEIEERRRLDGVMDSQLAKQQSPSPGQRYKIRCSRSRRAAWQTWNTDCCSRRGLKTGFRQ